MAAFEVELLNYPITGCDHVRKLVAKQLTQQAAEWQIEMNRLAKHRNEMVDLAAKHYDMVRQLKKELAAEKERGAQAVKEALANYEERSKYIMAVNKDLRQCLAGLLGANEDKLPPFPNTNFRTIELEKALASANEEIGKYQQQTIRMQADKEQAVAMERKNWEAYREGEQERLKAREQELWKAWVKTCSDDKVEMALDNYREGEAARIEAYEVEKAELIQSLDNAMRLLRRHELAAVCRDALKELHKASSPVSEPAQQDEPIWRDTLEAESIDDLCNIPHGHIATYDVNYRFQCSIGQGVAPWINAT